jgi:hypothetical protein
VRLGNALKEHVEKYKLHNKMDSIIALLGNDAQRVVDWAQTESKKRKKQTGGSSSSLGKLMFNLISFEAAIRLVQQNNAKGRLTTKNEVRLRTGQKVEMPVLYREAGLRHPQESRNLRHNLFHNAFVSLIEKLFPDVSTSVPSTGGSLSPDLLVYNSKPEWNICVEYKGYRSITLLSESEILKGMRYQAAYGTAWLVTSTNKTVKEELSRWISSKEIVKKGIKRLEKITKRRTYTEEQKENRGIARKGIKHLKKQMDLNLRCKIVTANEIIDSCYTGAPLEGLAITTGFEFIDLLKREQLTKEANNVLRIMKTPAKRLHSDSVTSVRLIG